MPFNNHTPYDYLPRRLYLEEIGNPLIAIHKFFDWENLPEWLAQLTKWHNAAATSGFQLTRSELVELFVRYEFFEYLVEALSLINNKIINPGAPYFSVMETLGIHCNQLVPDEINSAKGYFNNGFQPRWFDIKDYYPKYLTRTEQQYPYDIVRQVFRFYSLPDLRDALYWWYIVAMDETSCKDSRGAKYLKDLYQWMQKLIEASHLIHLHHL